MSQHDTLNIRLTPKLKAHYEAEAARFGKPLSTYIRGKLEAEYSYSQQLEFKMNEILYAINSFDHKKSNSSQENIEDASISSLLGIVLENLFLTRLIIKKVYPNEAERQIEKMIGEVKRRGLPVAGE